MSAHQPGVANRKQEDVSKSKPKVRVSVAFFDQNLGDEESFRVRYSGSLGKWAPLTELDYTPRGSTPLIDSTVRMIHHVADLVQDDRVNVGILIDESGSMAGRQTAVIDGVNEYVHGLTTVKAVDPKMAGKAIVVIVTDGQENASREHTYADVTRLTSEYEEKGWTFIYLGANQDAWATGLTLGLSGGYTGQSVNYTSTPTGVVSALRSVGVDSVSLLTNTAAYAASRAASSNRTITEDGEEVT